MFLFTLQCLASLGYTQFLTCYVVSKSYSDAVKARTKTHIDVVLPSKDFSQSEPM